jgi:N-acetylglucosamine kinase-like BadF-type ATPase
MIIVHPEVNSRLILSVDGGGTSTEVILADLDGKILGEGTSGPSNPKAVGTEGSMMALDQGIAAAFSNAGIEPGPVAVASLGLAGFDRDEDHLILKAWAGGQSVVPIGRLLMTNDGQLVLAAGTPDGWGVGIIGGTGSIAVGQSPDGKSARAGGWGFLIGDEGSAYKLVLDTLRFVAKSIDGRMPREATSESFTNAILKALGVTGDSMGLVSIIYEPSMNRTKIAGFAPQIIEAIRAEPRFVSVFLKPAGVELAEAAAAVARKLALPPGPLPLGLAGSFLIMTPEIKSALISHLERIGYQPQVTDVERPALGGLVLARKSLG